MSRKRATAGEGCLSQIVLWGLFGGAAGCVLSIVDKNIVGAIIGAAIFFGAFIFLAYNEFRSAPTQNPYPQGNNAKNISDRKIHYIPCPKCGRATDSGLNKCSHCGYELTKNSPKDQEVKVGDEKPKNRPNPNPTPEENAKEVYYTFLSLSLPISRNMSDRVFDQSLIISDTYRKDGKESAITKVKTVCKSWVELGSDGVLGAGALIDSLRRSKVLTGLEADKLITEISDWSIEIEKEDVARISKSPESAYDRAVARHGEDIFVSRQQGSLIQSSIATIMGISSPTVDDLDLFYNMYAFFGHCKANGLPVKDTVTAFLDKYYDYFNDDLECAYHVIAFCLFKLPDKDGDKIYYSNNPDPASVYLKKQIDVFANSFTKKQSDNPTAIAQNREPVNKRKDEYWECPNCGNVVGIHDVFCSKCGVRLNYSSHTSTSEPENAKSLSYDDKLIIRDNKDIGSRTIPVKAEITIIRSSGNEKKEIVSIFQKTPDTYYIDRSTFDRLKSNGVLCVQVYDGAKEKDRHYAEDGFGSLDDQSLLAKCGYTTKASEQLTDVQRQKVLLYLLKNDFWTKKRLISHLEWCIRNHPQDMYELNRAKWEKDIKYVKQVIV